LCNVLNKDTVDLKLNILDIPQLDESKIPEDANTADKRR
jgi:hypothetical protein